MLGRNILIAEFIRQGNTINHSHLAKVFGCSTRTIYRSLEQIYRAEEATKEQREKLFPTILFKSNNNGEN